MRDGNAERLVICCCADYGRLPRLSIERLAAAAMDAGIEVELCPDLCLAAVKDSEAFARYGEEGTVVAACFPRAVKALFSRAGHPAPPLVDLRGETVETAARTLGLSLGGGEESFPLLEYGDPWRAWYPAIDPERCSHCGRCIDFCLFGVYARKGEAVEVVAPDRCKTDCPACARACPEGAILFPKHPEAPINGGPPGPDAAIETATSGEGPGEGLYEKLAARRRKNRRTSPLKE